MFVGITRRVVVGGILVTAALAAADVMVKRAFGRPPRRTGPGPVAARDATIPTAGGSPLRGWLLSAPDMAAGAIVIHGWGGHAGDMAPVAHRLYALGLHVLAIDARGNGRSPGIAVSSMPVFAQDVRDATRWLRSQPNVDPARIVLVGHSVGAGASLFAASRDREVAAVVALAPMADPVGFMSERMRGRMPGLLIPLALRYIELSIGHRFEDFTPLNTIRLLEVPVLLVHGDRDDTVPLWHAQILYERAGGHSSLSVVEGADHFSVEALEDVDLAGFLAQAGVLPAQVSDAS